MMRSFRDCEGRRHTVRMTDEEILDRQIYWAGCGLVTLVCCVALVIASGIF